MKVIVLFTLVHTLHVNAETVPVKVFRSGLNELSVMATDTTQLAAEVPPFKGKLGLTDPPKDWKPPAIWPVAVTVPLPLGQTDVSATPTVPLNTIVPETRDK